jgi:hypothetical protein
MGFDLKGAAGGAMSGAGSGAVLGPWGAAAGGVMGGLLGGFGGGSTPQLPNAPNYQKAAQDQSISTRPNTENALGGQTWSTGPDGRPVSKMGFTGQANDAFQGLLGGMVNSSQRDPLAGGQRAFDTVYNQGAARLGPQWNANQSAFDAKMANQGLGAGTEANVNSSRTFGNQMNDAYGDLFSRSIGAGQAQQVQDRADANQPFQQAQWMQSMLNDQAPNYGQGSQDLNAAGMQWQSDLDRFSVQNKQNESKNKGLFGGFGDMIGGIGSMFG